MEWRRHIARYGDGWFPGEPWVRQTFVVLFLLAAALRFWNLPHLPFTHDELSALMRIYPTLGETIQRGVIELDTHPPGVQVFEWGWTRLFGTSEALVKLPFILLALVALFYFHRFALAWTSAGTALVMTALLATLQYTVLYAQIARPYAFGFFTMALLADSLTRYLAFGTRRTLVMVGIAAVLCAYTHHFTLLLAAIMVASVFAVVPRGQWKHYLAMCVIAVFAYAPNLPVFAKQLSLGGLGGWLPPPDAGWLPRYLGWILHFSFPLMLCVGGVVGLAVFGALHKGVLPGPARWLLPLWALSPLAIGYTYSVWREPVLQYSMLLFSFPFLLCWLFVGLRHSSRTFVIGAVAVLALLSTKTLITDRQHYAIFNDSPYAAMVRVAMDQVKEHGAGSTLVVFDAPRPQVEFHVRRHGLDTLCTIHWPRTSEGTGTLLNALFDPRSERIVLGTTNGQLPERLAQAQAIFPYTLALEDHVEGQVRVLSKTASTSPIVDRERLAGLRAGHHQGSFEVDASLPMVHDPDTRTSAWAMEGSTFGLASTYRLLPDTYDPRDQFEAEMCVTQAEAPDTLAVVLELRQGLGTLIYRSSPVPTMGNTSYAVASLSPSWVLASPVLLELGVYAYDPSGHASGQIHHLRLYKRMANPVVDALMVPVRSMGHHPK